MSLVRENKAWGYGCQHAEAWNSLQGSLDAAFAGVGLKVEFRWHEVKILGEDRAPEIYVQAGRYSEGPHTVEVRSGMRAHYESTRAGTSRFRVGADPAVVAKRVAEKVVWLLKERDTLLTEAKARREAREARERAAARREVERAAQEAVRTQARARALETSRAILEDRGHIMQDFARDVIEALGAGGGA